MNIRQFAFWLLDSLRGGETSKHRQDVAKILLGERTANKHLENILKYATQQVPYYKDIQSINLNEFPIITKLDIRNDATKFRPIIPVKISRTMKTSGSSGEPFQVPQCQEKTARSTADLIEIHSQCGWEIGDKFIFLRAWSGNYSRNSIKCFLQNMQPFCVTQLNQHGLEELRQIIKNDSSNKIILGYGSALSQLASYCLNKGDGPDDFSISVVVSDSDQLTRMAHENLRTLFNCTIINRYSTEELGILAYTPPGSQQFRINNASYHFEFLELNSNKPAPPGKLGRIIVTDLFNRALPLIRYDTGDLAVAPINTESTVHHFEGLEGRIGDALITNEGTVVTEVMLSSYLEGIPSIKQYQCIQKPDQSFELLYVADPDHDPNAIRTTLTKCLGESSTISMSMCSEIPKGINGKFKTAIRQ